MIGPLSRILLSGLLMALLGCTDAIPEISKNNTTGVAPNFNGSTSKQYDIADPADNVSVIGAVDARIRSMQFRMEGSSNWLDVSTLAHPSSDLDFTDANFDVRLALGALGSYFTFTSGTPATQKFYLRGETVFGPTASAEVILKYDGGTGGGGGVSVEVTSPDDSSGTVYVNAGAQSSFPVSGICSEDGQDVIVSSSTEHVQVACSSGAWTTNLDLSSESEGVVSIAINHSDFNGNNATDSLSVTKDSSAPTGLAVDSGCPAWNDYTTTNDFDVNVSATDAISGIDHYWFEVDSSGTDIDCATFCDIDDLSEGFHTIEFFAIDLAGNVSTSASCQFTVDTIAPYITDVTVDLSTGVYGIGQVVNIYINFNETVSFALSGPPALLMPTGIGGGTSLVTSTSSGAVSRLDFSYTVAVGDSANPFDYDSEYAFNLSTSTVVDLAGNALASSDLPVPGALGSISASKTIEIDGVRPVVNITRDGGQAATDTSLPINFIVDFNGEDLTYTVGSAVNATGLSSPAATGVTYVKTDLTQSVKFSVTSVITDGYVAPEISASMFQDAAGNDAEVIYDGGAPGAPTGIEVLFDFPDPTLSISPPPTPEWAHKGGGEVVTITGTNFVAGVTEAFLDKMGVKTLCAPTTVNTPTELTCTLPAHTTGFIEIGVRNYGDEAKNGFLIYDDAVALLNTVSTGNQTSFVISPTFEKAWGAGDYGKLGLGHSSDELSPVDMDLSDTYFSGSLIEISAGHNHTCALEGSGQIWCWGNGSMGQLGNGGGMSDIPYQIGEITSAKSVCAGMDFSCAVLNEAGENVRCFGHGATGAMGDGDTANNVDMSNDLDPVLGVQDAADVTCGYSHACALTKSGRVYCWGEQTYGRLGNGQSGPDSVHTPVELGLSGIKQVSAGGQHTCAIRQDDQVICWGRNNLYQLGLNSPGIVDDASLASPVTGTGFIQVSAGAEHTCAVNNAGIAFCWGSDGYGKLGNGPTSGQKSDPQSVVGIDGSAGNYALQIEAGQQHTCAHLDDGSVRCWGYGGSGAVGDGVNGGSIPSPYEAVSATPATTHTVFVTSTTHTGALGGLAGADAICQARADTSGVVTGTYKAIMSDSANSAQSRLVITGDIRNTDGSLVSTAANFWTFADFATSISRDEYDNPISPTYMVWTGTDDYGNSADPDFADNCNDWTSGSSSENAWQGHTSMVNASWANMNFSPCDTTGRLYCISQP
jgi:alpha-tubulin suppressor-like RCC1 family protein